MRKKTAAIALYMSPLAVLPFACISGAYSLSPGDVFHLSLYGLSGGAWQAPPDLPREAYTVFYDIRLPRIVLAMLVGISLAASGAALQAVSRNPLVDSYMLGLSAGAAFGAALALAALPVPVQLSAFVFGLTAVVLTYTAAYSRGSISPVSLVLAGVMISAVFTVLLALVNMFADPLKLRSIVYWTMGCLHLASWAGVESAAPWILLSVTFLYFKRWKLNILSFGDDEARSMGVSPESEKRLVIAASALATSAAVAVAGVIGILGLMIPHVVRMLVGPDHVRLIPLSMALGASFLLAVDTFARSTVSFEIPAGFFTTLIGAPFFIYLLRKTQAGGWQ